MSDSLRGTFPVLPTPFTPAGAIDRAGLRRVAEFALSRDVDGVVFPGLASEYVQLDHRERLSLTTLVGKVVGTRTKFVVGASAETTELAIEYAKAGAASGACCAMVTARPAMVTARPPDGLVPFFETLAAAVDIPLMLQNAPAPMGAGLPVDRVIEVLKAVPAVAYVKEESLPCGQRIERILAGAPQSLRGVFGGAGGRYIVDELNRGSAGTLPAVELVELHVELMKAYRRGDHVKARHLFQLMLPVLNMQAVYRCSLTKQVLVLREVIDCARVRAPGPAMDAADVRELRAFWEQVEPWTGPLAARTTSDGPRG